MTMRRPLRVFGRSAVAQFAVSGLVATLVIGLTSVAVSRRVGTREAIRDAEQVTRLVGEGFVEPGLTEDVLAGRPRAVRAFDAEMRRKVMRDGIVRVKVWNAQGRIVYSDMAALIDQRFEVDADERAALNGSGVHAEVSDLSKSENRFERSAPELLEVYVPIRGPRGERLVFEAYQRFHSVAASGRRLWGSFAPALIGGLVLLQLINLPLARSLARRIRRGQEEREALLHRTLDASQTERRLIAADLHDGIVQDLAGVSFVLAAEAQRVNGFGGGGPGRALLEGAARTRDSVRALRTLLVDIYPPSLHRAGLAAALGDLATTHTNRGLATTVELDAEIRATEGTERLLFRIAQEALRNAAKHAEATRAVLRLRRAGDDVCIEVCDDGRGFDPAVLDDRATQGHLGLRLVADLVHDAGGRLDVTSSKGVGTTIRAEVPA